MYQQQQQGFGSNGAPYAVAVNGADYAMSGGYGSVQQRQSMQSPPYGNGPYIQQSYGGPMGPGRPGMMAGVMNSHITYNQQGCYGSNVSVNNIVYVINSSNVSNNG